eukprot:1147992-Pelagomonas_calceolata.AAC.4
MGITLKRATATTDPTPTVLPSGMPNPLALPLRRGSRRGNTFHGTEQSALPSAFSFASTSFYFHTSTRGLAIPGLAVARPAQARGALITVPTISTYALIEVHVHACMHIHTPARMLKRSCFSCTSTSSHSDGSTPAGADLPGQAAVGALLTCLKGLVEVKAQRYVHRDKGGSGRVRAHHHMHRFAMHSGARGAAQHCSHMHACYSITAPRE